MSLPDLSIYIYYLVGHFLVENSIKQGFQPSGDLDVCKLFFGWYYMT